MWWEKWIPISYLTKSTVCAVDCIVDETGVSFHYAVLEIKKNKVEISKQGNSNEVSEIITIAKKAVAPITLSINGKGVIVKKIIFSENESLQLPDLLNQHLPAIPVNDFYTQFYKNGANSGHISICRKDQINELLNEFSRNKVELINVFIGPLICNALSSITNPYNCISTSTNQLELSNGFVESVQSINNNVAEHLLIGDVKITPQQIVSFSAGFSYFSLQTNYESDNSEINNLPKRHVEKIKTKLLLIVLIAVMFVISGVNSVLFFRKFEENSTLEVELNLYESKNNQITELLDNYQKKKNLIEQAGMFENKKMSVYADKIAASLPNEILLRELYFNPEEGDTEEDSLMDFKNNELIIKGNCNKSLLLNEWINVLKSLNFVKNINLETFSYNSEGHIPNFVLKIDTQ